MDWKRIKAEYISGGTSYRRLAEKYKVSFSTLRKIAAKENWTELRSKAGTKTDTKLVENVSDRQAQKAAKINNVADKLLERISEIIDGINSTQEIKHLSSALKDIKEIKGVKSDLDLREQEARIEKIEREAVQENHAPLEVIVSFGADNGECEWAE